MEGTGEEKRKIQETFADGMKELALEPDCVQLVFKDDILILEGRVEHWQQVVDIGHMAAKLPGVTKLVNHLTSEDQPEPEPENTPEAKEERLAAYREMDVGDHADVVIIGAGITGCGIARELSKYKLNLLVLEKEEDISCGTTKSNNGMVHSGYDSKHGSLKAEMNVRGNAMYTQWAQDLHFAFNRTGSFVLAFTEEEHEKLKYYLENGTKNGVPGIALITGDEARQIEPNVSDEARWALWTPSAGYVEPYEVALALMENAIDNGARLRLSCQVEGIEKEKGRATVLYTNQGRITCDYLINAAGLYADEIARMLDDEFFTIHPRRGTLVIFDKENKGKIHTYSGQAPGNYTKGGGPQETPEGTLLFGPSAKEVPEKDDLGVDQDDLDFVINKGMFLIKNVDRASMITYFSGNRAATYMEDFIIQRSETVENVIHAAGIQSPGLASAPAVAERVEHIFCDMAENVQKDEAWNPIRERRKPIRFCSMEEREARIQENPLYGHVICRCETVTEGEIVDAIHGKVPATNVDAVKRRTRAGMGRCQGGFCQAKVLEILARELAIPETEVTLKGSGSAILCSETRPDSAPKGNAPEGENHPDGQKTDKAGGRA